MTFSTRVSVREIERICSRPDRASHRLTESQDEASDRDASTERARGELHISMVDEAGPHSGQDGDERNETTKAQDDRARTRIRGCKVGRVESEYASWN